jgi:hypothetical protein
MQHERLGHLYYQLQEEKGYSVAVVVEKMMMNHLHPSREGPSLKILHHLREKVHWMMTMMRYSKIKTNLMINKKKRKKRQIS